MSGVNFAAAPAGLLGRLGCCAAAPRCVLNARAAAAAAAAACWRHRVSAAHAGGAAGAANAGWPQTQVGASQRVCHSLTRPSPAHLGSQRSCAIYRSQPASSSTCCEALDEHGKVRRRFQRPRPPAGRHGHKRHTCSRAGSRAAEAWYSQRHGHTAIPSPPSHLTVHSTTGQRLWGVERPARLDGACNARSRSRPRRRACLGEHGPAAASSPWEVSWLGPFARYDIVPHWPRLTHQPTAAWLRRRKVARYTARQLLTSGDSSRRHRPACSPKASEMCAPSRLLQRNRWARSKAAARQSSCKRSTLSGQCRRASATRRRWSSCTTQRGPRCKWAACTPGRRCTRSPSTRRQPSRCGFRNSCAGAGARTHAPCTHPRPGMHVPPSPPADRALWLLQAHAEFRRVMREKGVRVLTVREILAFGTADHVGARVELEEFAMQVRPACFLARGRTLHQPAGGQ